MRSDSDELAAYLLEQVAASGDGDIFWLGIVGAPGSGKSTLSRILSELLGDIALVVPMDGYHFYQAELDRMDDPVEAHKRRGAPFTFNAKRFVADLAEAQRRREGLFPSFDHGKGDPVEGDIRLIEGQHRVVIIEGNYLLLDDPPWNQLRSLLDEFWFVSVDIEVCMERVRARFLDTGRDEQTADFRVRYNDRPNAELIIRVSPQYADRLLTFP